MRIRLYVDTPLAAGPPVDARDEHAHYLLNVMRRGVGDEVLLFNGRDGEWQARIEVPAKKRVRFAPVRQTRVQINEPDVWVAFAPVKRIEVLAEKASELGVAALLPVFTCRTDIARVNTARLKANAVEAAEQCDRLTIPAVHDAVKFDAFITAWPRTRTLYFLDETGGGAPIAAALTAADPKVPVGFLTGPEGGFDQRELDALRQLPFAKPVGLGPRLLRAETAAIAAVVCWQALQGDWVSAPHRD